MARAKIAASRSKSVVPDRRTLQRAAQLFKQVSDASRLTTLLLLNEGQRNVTQLVKDLALGSQPAVSHHLALLRYSGLIKPRRDGKHNVYTLTDEGRTLLKAIAVIMPR
jgi:DNA-binding transcriptional ArsR family regulator